MELGLKGKVAIVGGASEGIGYGIARLLAGEGCKVAMVARRKDVLDSSVKKLMEETKSDQVGSGILKNPIPGARMFKIVVM